MSKVVAETKPVINIEKAEKAIQNYFKRQFVCYSDTLHVLTNGLEFGENVLLYGRGGHGKSLMVEEFFKALFKESGFTEDQAKENKLLYIKALGKGTKIEDIFGGLKLKHFQETGELEYNVENSFMNYEYVVFEEGFDAPLPVLEQLKDILTAKEFRNGHQTFKLKTKCIIICTNRSKEELADNDSLKALMERFPYEMKVEWSSYSSDDYFELFQKRKSAGELKGGSLSDLNTFANMVEMANRNTFISPRTAVKACKVYLKKGLDGLKGISGFKPGVIRNLIRRRAEIEEVEKAKRTYNLFDSNVRNLLSKLQSLSSDSLEKAIACKGAINVIYNDINSNLSVRDTLYDQKQNLLNTVSNVQNSIESNITRLQSGVNITKVEKYKGELSSLIQKHNNAA